MSRQISSLRMRFNRAALALFALLLTYPVLVAARNFLADVYAEPAKEFLQYNRDEGYDLTEDEWQAIDTNLQRALKLVPNNPATLTELGRLHRIQLEIDTLESKDIERHGAHALDYYERASVLRPTWPWGWSSMALVRYELYQDSDDAYHQALIRAAHFGPWQGSIQRLIVELSLDTWENLSPDVRQAVLATADRALKRQPAGLNAIVNADDSWPTLCGAAAPFEAQPPGGNAALNLMRLQQHCNELALVEEES